ncbi:alpha/beta fold hydrolase [Parendozoicomonas haliclonae]|uniref:Esterase YbfF n=1 Tax=Parendozoicomonas haliclonae TaxID=1960125 RepID=A0A1X7AFH1_9GAMM|nr:alpha/beta fold hydrolase [Parendozoicomonas haliclonae]SMA37788.1 Esterase YbfF [Parendozoicomonas haliclonae]
MTDDRILNYRVQGREKGEGEPLFILHGLFGNMDNLTPVARRLAEQYQVISVDLRNHGRSFHDEEMNYQVMAADVVRLMDHLAIEQAIVLGHSMGGKTAMQMALDFPQRIKAIIVGDIAPVSYTHRHENVIQAIENYQPELATSRAEADAQFARFIEMPAVRQLLIKSLMRNDQGEFVWRMNAPALVANYDEIRSEPDNTGKSFTGPVLFVKGGESDYLLPEHKSVIGALFPNASLKVVSGVGHWLHAEKPELFNGIVERFLSEL